VDHKAGTCRLTEGMLVGCGLQATKAGVSDRIEEYLEQTWRAKFHLSIAFLL